ncbi:homeobox protein TGIF2-like [Hyperolius riggenbachi]|uniref:homeobox protein TGIF2-like n=1 Tax=Hyperolius riggenbachi TaxID=752182 RepID=UPI0035A2F5C3
MLEIIDLAGKVTHDQDVENSPERRKRENLPKEATDFLRNWLFEHLDDPFPTTEEKEFMLEKTGLTATQLNNWFINARRRYAPKMRKDAENPTEAQNGNTPLPDATENPSTSGTFVLPVVLVCPVSSPVQPYADPQATRPLAAPATKKGYGNDSNRSDDAGHTAATASSAGISQAGPSSSISAQEASVPQERFSAMYILGLVCGRELEILEREAKQMKSLHA